MIKDFKDANNDIITMDRGTDKTHRFQFHPDDGSTFVYANYNLVCEGRFSPINEEKNFDFPVTVVVDEDAVTWGEIALGKALITNLIREGKIYYRVLATTKTAPLKTIVINYGEVWLK